MTEELKQLMLANGWTQSGNWWISPGGFIGKFKHAAREFANTYPHLPSISRAEAIEMIASATKKRLDVKLPASDMTPAIRALASLPSEEIRLNSAAYQSASAMLDVAAWGEAFAARREVIARHHPGLSELPCDIAVAVSPIAREVYDGAVLMGRAMSYPCRVSLDTMVSFAHLDEGCTILQPEPYSYECWVIPNGQPAVYAVGYPNYNNEDGVAPWVYAAICPHPKTVVGWIK